MGVLCATQRRVAAVVLLVALAGGRAPADEGESLDAALLRAAPQVFRALKERGCRNVGVLKFRVKKGDEAASDRVGTLNRDLAAKLEVALILANDFKAPLGVIHDASAVAATLPGANHLTAEGRRALFRGRYPLAWGGERVAPDAFLTGVALLAPDLKTVTVSVQVIGRDGGKPAEVARLTASSDPPVLTAAGESFALSRGLFDGGQVKLSRVVASAVTVQSGKAAHPLMDPEAPVALEVLYDGQPVPLEVRDGKARVPEPREGERVSFVLRKIDRTPDRYGIVLLVNGESTLFRERSDPLSCRMWVLGPDHPKVTVRGYQTGDDAAESFRVLAPAESAKNAIDYGADVGTVTLVVFRGAASDAPPPDLGEEAEDLAAVSRAAFPARPPRNLAALKQQLRQDDGATSRGLVIPGGRIDAPIRRVAFRPDPTPVLSATITYYRP